MQSHQIMFTTRMQSTITQHYRNKKKIIIYSGEKMIINKDKPPYDPAVRIGQEF